MPKSSTVSGGQQGTPAQYNNLRTDALNQYALGSILTISGGIVTKTTDYTFYKIAAESGTEDDLDTISGGSEGDVLFLVADTGDTITLTTSGNIAKEIVLSDAYAVILRYDGTNWQIISLPVPTSRNAPARIAINLADADTALIVEDGVASYRFHVPDFMDGWVLKSAHACVITASTSGTPTFQIYNVTDAVDMLSTAITIDANEKSSYTAAVQPVVDTTNDDVATADEIRIDCDVIGTGTKGLTIILIFEEQ